MKKKLYFSKDINKKEINVSATFDEKGNINEINANSYDDIFSLLCQDIKDKLILTAMDIYKKSILSPKPDPLL